MTKIVLSSFVISLALAKTQSAWVPVQEEVMDFGEYQVEQTVPVESTVQTIPSTTPSTTFIEEDPAFQNSVSHPPPVTPDLAPVVKPPKPVTIDIVSKIKSSKNLKVALLVPKRVIKGYAKKVSNTILGYLIHKHGTFEYEVFDSIDESEFNIVRTLEKIRQKGYNFIIAPCTLSGANLITSYESRAVVYVPTINANDIDFRASNVIFGGVDYKAQIDKLMDLTNDKISVFTGKSFVADRLTSYVTSHWRGKNIYQKKMDNVRVNLKYTIKNNHRLKDSSIFLNMPLVSSALIASSLPSYDIEPFGFFSTQINYSPLLFSLIQKKDRKNFYIANSIGYINSRLDDLEQNLGNRIKYDWISYSTAIGLDYAYSKVNFQERLFNENILNNQVKYQTRVVKIDGNEFKRVD